MANSLAPPTTSPDDQIRFVESVRPPLRDGDYMAEIRLTLEDPGGDAKAENRTEVVTANFTVSGDRWSLAQGLVEHVFPPPGSKGPFDRVLPHVVLKRETLPWERSPHGEGHEEPLTPSWLAVLVFVGDEVTKFETIAAGELEKTAGTEIANDPAARASVISVPRAVLEAQIPTYEDLGLNAHAREIVPADGGAGRSRAVIIGQRMAKHGSVCTAHLVSLEHAYFQDRKAPAEADGPVTACLNEAWDSIKTAVAELEGKQKASPQEARAAANQLKTLEVELRCAGEKPELFAPMPGDFPALHFDPAITDQTIQLDETRLAKLAVSKPMILDERGKRVATIEILVDILPAPKPKPKPAPAEHADPKGAKADAKKDDTTKPPPLPEALRHLFEGLPSTAVRAHYRQGLRPVYFHQSALAAHAGLSADSILDAVLPDKIWRDRLRDRRSIRFERWWVFDGVSRKLIVEANRRKEIDTVTLTLRPEVRYRFGKDDDHDPVVRLVSLHHWTFTCDQDDHGHFGTRGMAILPGAGIDGCLRLPQNDSTPAAAREFLDAGYVALPHHLRSGESAISWYRGPLAAALPATPALPHLPASSADALLLFDEPSGLFDTSWAAAWELGRQLALSDRKFSHELAVWKRAHREAQYALRRRLDAQFSIAHPLPVDTRIPATIGDWLDRLAVLEGVPFCYLVPDPRMLPAESLRFFTVDPGWIESLRDGALSIARVHAADHAQHEVHLEQLAPPPRLSGVIIRSSVVKDWPDLVVRGWVRTVRPEDASWQSVPDLGGSGLPYRELTAVRQTHLAPDILLLLFEDPREVEILEMHVQPQMLHFGLEGEDGHWHKDVRDPNTGLFVQTVVKASLSVKELTPHIEAQSDKTIQDALKRRAARWKEGRREWEGKELLDLQAGIPSAGTTLDEESARKVAKILYDAAHKLPSNETVPIEGICWRGDESAGVLDLFNLFQLLSDSLRAVNDGRAVTTGEFALTMLDSPAIVRVLRKFA
jgi:hypothetical protein